MMKSADLARAIAAEHAEIERAVEGIGREIDRLCGETGPEHPVGQLSSLLRGLQDHLRRHFHLEERGGFLVEGTPVEPGAERKTALLLGQHRDLERVLDALVDGVERAKAGRAALSEGFVGALRAFLRDLLEHENAENEFVSSVVLRDVGAGD